VARKPVAKLATTTLNIRGIDAKAVTRAKAAAAVRGMTLGEYIAAVIALHDAMRALADSGRHDQVVAELKALGLETVTA
jgi:hypothetical protein